MARCVRRWDTFEWFRVLQHWILKVTLRLTGSQRKQGNEELLGVNGTWSFLAPLICLRNFIFCICSRKIQEEEEQLKAELVLWDLFCIQIYTPSYYSKFDLHIQAFYTVYQTHASCRTKRALFNDTIGVHALGCLWIRLSMGKADLMYSNVNKWKAALSGRTCSNNAMWDRYNMVNGPMRCERMLHTSTKVCGMFGARTIVQIPFIWYYEEFANICNLPKSVDKKKKKKTTTIGQFTNHKTQTLAFGIVELGGLIQWYRLRASHSIVVNSRCPSENDRSFCMYFPDYTARSSAYFPHEI